MKLPVVEKNAQGGYFQRGKSFDETKWASIVDAYRHEIDTTGKCTINRLMELTKIGRKSAMKAINYHNLDSIPFLKKNARKGVGSYKRTQAIFGICQSIRSIALRLRRREADERDPHFWVRPPQHHGWHDPKP